MTFKMTKKWLRFYVANSSLLEANTARIAPISDFIALWAGLFNNTYVLIIKNKIILIILGNVTTATSSADGFVTPEGHHTMEFFEMCAALITQLAR